MLVVKSLKRFEHPTEADTWFDLELPLAAGDLEALPESANSSRLKVAILLRVMKAWSYAEPITAATVAALDVGTFVWLADVAVGTDAQPARPARKRRVTP